MLSVFQKYIFPTLVFMVGFYLLGIRLVGWDMDGIPGDMGDARLNNYFLEQGHLYITGKISSYWNAPFFYPEKATMSISDNLWGTLPIYSFFRLLSFDRGTAFQLWFLSLLALNFIICFICIKKLGMSPVAAALGAYIFAYAMPVAGGLGHIQMLPKFAFPIIMLGLIQFIRTKKPRYLLIFLLFLAYQMFCGIYLGLMAILASSVVLIIQMVLRGFKSEMKSLGLYIKNNWRITILMLTTYMGSMIWLLLPYFLRSDDVKRTYMDPARGMPTLASYFFPVPDSLLYDWLRPLEVFLYNSHEHTMFMGMSFLSAIVLSIYFIKTKKLKELRLWLFSLVSIIVLTLNVWHYVSFYIVVYILPGFKAIRAVSRIVQLELFFLGCLIAQIVDKLLGQITSVNGRMVIAILVFGLILVDQFEFKTGLMIFSKSESQQRVFNLTQEITRLDISGYNAFAYLPGDTSKVYKYHLDAMLVAQDIGLPSINGYSAFSPNGFQEFFELPDKKNLEHLLERNQIADSTILIIQ